MNLKCLFFLFLFLLSPSLSFLQKLITTLIFLSLLVVSFHVVYLLHVHEYVFSYFYLLQRLRNVNLSLHLMYLTNSLKFKFACSSCFLATRVKKVMKERSYKLTRANVNAAFLRQQQTAILAIELHCGWQKINYDQWFFIPSN